MKISADGDYIYRGEPECYKKVSSNLYRELERLELLDQGIEEIEKTELEEAKDYIDETDEFKILIQIQHYDGKTNLIDFTTDYYVALFFAVNSSPGKDGRIILQSKTGATKDWIRKLPDPSPWQAPCGSEKYICPTPRGFLSLVTSLYQKRSLSFLKTSNFLC